VILYKNKNMASIEELKLERQNKLSKLEAGGFEIYPAHTNRNISIRDFLINFEIENDSEKNILAGRIMSSRGQGNLIFFDIFDGSSELNQDSKVQAIIKKPESSDNVFEYYKNYCDIGDFVEVSGERFLSKTGQKSLLVKEIKILTKALLPLPDKFHGLENEELKLRYRYLDILTDNELRELIYKKSKFWKVTRNFFEECGFLEVETPTIETTTGGAEARPFNTHHNDFDIEVYMRICVGELWQKRLLSAGFEKTFEIGRAYRNEGSSPNHLQEFTNCEFYWAYADYKDAMNLTKELYRKIAKEVFGKTEFTHAGMTFDLDHDWVEIDYVNEIKNQTNIDVNLATDEEIKNKLEELNVKYEGENRERLMDTLWKYCRKNIAGPGFLVNHPTITSPLAKRRKENINTVEKFQIILAGAEVGNGYSEQNNPNIQRESFEQQQKLLESGDEEAMMPDWDFVEMLEHGMPPAVGFGFGERLFAFLAGRPIREVVTFPLVKDKSILNKKNKKENKIAVVILNKESNLEKWQEMNTVGHLCVEFAGKTKTDLFYKDKIVTKDNEKINLNMQYPILIKESKDSIELIEFIKMLKENNIDFSAFTREMLNTTNDKKVLEQTKGKDFNEIEFLGILVFGEKNNIENLTKDFKLYI